MQLIYNLFSTCNSFSSKKSFSFLQKKAHRYKKAKDLSLILSEKSEHNLKIMRISSRRKDTISSTDKAGSTNQEKDDKQNKERYKYSSAMIQLVQRENVSAEQMCEHVSQLKKKGEKYQRLYKEKETEYSQLLQQYDELKKQCESSPQKKGADKTPDTYTNIIATNTASLAQQENKKEKAQTSQDKLIDEFRRRMEEKKQEKHDEIIPGVSFIRIFTCKYFFLECILLEKKN
ncbi:hypothetical protein RFI_01813 [Reticulomyxa filosa]|uniref:Uncharacterized protein n=1 Tax=Reticulomyxa filosa TaxID=46433 RepID=X6PAS4_RETFI|nr:hypothetical protein RFI_01813 [Reticulomyxa filosa]|eukprot:ETO35251.1 hypothetical protein RFI_01813 [Reticulomyxa filosa]